MMIHSGWPWVAEATYIGTVLPEHLHGRLRARAVGMGADRLVVGDDPGRGPGREGVLRLRRIVRARDVPRVGAAGAGGARTRPGSVRRPRLPLGGVGGFHRARRAGRQRPDGSTASDGRSVSRDRGRRRAQRPGGGRLLRQGRRTDGRPRGAEQGRRGGRHERAVPRPPGDQGLHLFVRDVADARRSSSRSSVCRRMGIGSRRSVRTTRRSPTGGRSRSTATTQRRPTLRSRSSRRTMPRRFPTTRRGSTASRRSWARCCMRCRRTSGR